MPHAGTKRWRWPIVILAYWAVIAAAAYRHTIRPGGETLLEMAAQLLLLLALFAIPALRSAFIELRSGYKLLVAGLGAVILAGQIISNDRKTYPFPNWPMFCRPVTSDTVTHIDFIATYATGKSGYFPLHDITHSRFPQAFKRRFKLPVRAYVAGAADSTILDSLERDVTRLIGIYNARTPDDPVRSIAVIQRRFRISEYAKNVPKQERMFLVVNAEGTQ